MPSVIARESDAATEVLWSRLGRARAVAERREATGPAPALPAAGPVVRLAETESDTESAVPTVLV